MRLRRAGLALIGTFAIAAVLIAATFTVRAQDTSALRYGDMVNGEIKAVKPNDSALYTFIAQANDVITITMVRKSGTLRPAIALGDLSKTGKDLLVGVSTLSADGKTATLADFTIKTAGAYAILATYEGKTVTTGKFTLTLDNASNPDTPTDTPVPTKKANATPTKKANATPTKKPNVQPTATPEEATAEPAAGVQTFSVGTSPTFSIWSGNNLYVSNQGDGTISILDGDGNSTGSIKVGGTPFAMAWDGARLWVSDYGTTDKPGNSVSVFDAKGKKIGTYKVGGLPFSLSFDADSKLMWVALYADNKVVAVDAKGKVTTTVDVSEAGSNPNTVLWNGTQLFATLAGTQQDVGSTVIAIGTDGTITGTYIVGKNPADLAWDDTDQLLFVANYDDNTVTALDADGKSVGTYKVGKNPSALAWDGTNLWVSLSGDSAIVALSPKGKVLAKIPLSSAPNGVTYDGTSMLWVALQGTANSPGSEVARIEISTALGQ